MKNPELAIEGLEPIIEAYTDIILQNQDRNGTYPATGQPDYEYSDFRWIRDASFTAFGLVERLKNTSDRSVMHKLNQSLEANFEWWFDVMQSQRDRLEYLLANHSVENFIKYGLPGRFTLAKEPDDSSEWSPLQLDGFGSFFAVLGAYACSEHGNGRNLAIAHQQEIDLLGKYLSKFFSYANFDMWEDSQFWGKNGCLHASTLATIHAGLRELTQVGISDWSGALINIRAFFDQTFINQDGEIVKYVQVNPAGDYSIPHPNADHVDASMLFLVGPFAGMYTARSPAMTDVASRVETLLTSEDGGVRRYPTDEFYGGGEWPLLSALQGLFYLQAGNTDMAMRNAQWIISKHDQNFRLPEQIVDTSNPQYQKWEQMWGPPTSPLLMGHGLSITLFERLKVE